MTESRRQWGENGYAKVARYWPFILAASAVIGTWSVMRAQVPILQKQVEKAEDKIDVHETRLSKVEQAVEQLPEIRNDIKEILKRVK